MKHALLAPAILLTSLSLLKADVEVVFEHLITDENNPLPILKAQTDIPAEETFDGSFAMDSYGGLERYDANRLLLGIRENGINETDANHNSALAAQYPDRSLIWIDQTTGAPMGIALEIGTIPLPVDQDFLDADGTERDYYFTFGVDDAGVIYTNHKNRLLRYAPDGNGGFEEPTIAYTHENDGSERWYQWRFETIKVSGSGEDTVIIAGGKTWRPNQGYREFTTEDGLTFTEQALAGCKGGGSTIIPAPFGETATQEWMYGSLYPGGSNGKDTSIIRNVRDKALDEPFGGSTFRVQKDEEIGYTALFISDTEVHPDFPYLVSYSTPSWNSMSEAIALDPPTPGWIAVHDQFYDPDAIDDEGLARLIGLHKINVTEADELAGDASLFHGTMGELTLNVLPGMRPGAAELLWHSGIYGYGRYILDFSPKPIDITNVARVSPEEATLSWTSETSKFYTIQSSTDLTAESWTTVADGIPGSEGGVTTASVPIAADDSELYVRVGFGKIYAEDFESGATGWTTGTLEAPFADSGTTQWSLGTPSGVGPSAAHSGENVYGTNLDSNYGTFTNITLTSPVIDLTSVERGTLRFWQFTEASDQEGGQLRVLNEAGDSILAESEIYNVGEGDWAEVAISLLNFGDTQNSVVGQKVRLEFRFLSDDLDGDDGAGWYIDDLTIE